MVSSRVLAASDCGREIHRRLVNAIEQAGEYRLRERQKRLGELRIAIGGGFHYAHIDVR